jgi:hypothetical protein
LEVQEAAVSDPGGGRLQSRRRQSKVQEVDVSVPGGGCQRSKRCQAVVLEALGFFMRKD